MASIKSGVSSDLLTIDPTSKAARVTLYNPLGGVISIKKATYMAANSLTVSAAGTGVFASIFGSNTKKIHIHRIRICGTVATAAVYGSVILNKRTTAGTGGTSTVLTPIPADLDDSAATGTVRFYTALGTAGTGGGICAATTALFPITATPTTSPAIIDFTPQVDSGAETKDFVLRSASEGLELSFSATTTNAPSLSIWITWTEE